MIKALPNKWIKKALFDVLNGIVVDGKTIKCYDNFVTGNKRPNNYILLTTQSNEVEKANKCEYFWDSDILIDIVTIYQRSGNTGSTLLVDNISDEVRRLTDVLVLDPASGLEIFTQTQSFPNTLSQHSQNEIIFRNLVRITMRIQ